MDLALSNREEEAVLILIKNDCGIKQVANKMDISDRTAEKHFENAKKKKNVNTLSGLVFKYLKNHKELLAFIFLSIQIFSSVGISEDSQRRRKRGRRIAKITRVQKVQNKAIA